MIFIHTPVEFESKLILESEIFKREKEAKDFFIQYINSYYKDVATVDIPLEKISWGEDIKISKEDLKRIKEEYGVDALVLGEIPWYGKTNIIWLIIGLTTDLAVETLVIGYVTKWNPTILLANLGWELVVNTPLWFGGSYLFGQAYKPVTIEAKLYKLTDGFKETSSDFEVTKSRHMLEKLPKKERKKIENQLDASLKKALKEIAIELGSQ